MFWYKGFGLHASTQHFYFIDYKIKNFVLNHINLS
ncbi:hypothetical protein PPM_2371 [Paenibacillus polymyxa M1]|nr:hypothetical protein PPM_2371 [Paenibacillus polymyxa M1]